jgi:hypothetical protein
MTPSEQRILQAAPPAAHHWIAVTAPNGDCGFQCSRCKLTAISLPVPKECAHCPHFADA